MSQIPLILSGMISGHRPSHTHSTFAIGLTFIRNNRTAITFQLFASSHHHIITSFPSHNSSSNSSSCVSICEKPTLLFVLWSLPLTKGHCHPESSYNHRKQAPDQGHTNLRPTVNKFIRFVRYYKKIHPSIDNGVLYSIEPFGSRFVEATCIKDKTTHRYPSHDYDHILFFFVEP